MAARKKAKRTVAAAKPSAPVETAQKAAVAAMAKAADTGARTIVYVHGIGNKPVASILKCQWDMALFNFDLGERSRLAYWVNRGYYPAPEKARCDTGDLVDGSGPAIRTLGIPAGDAVSVAHDIVPYLTDKKSQQQALYRIAQSLKEHNGGVGGRTTGTRGLQAKVLPLPAPIRNWITRELTEAFLRDVNDFLFVEERRKEMEQSVLERLESGGGPFVVIGHSQGSMIAYKVLCELDKAKYDVRLFVTIGSPLGLTEVQDGLKSHLKGHLKGGKLAVPACVRAWLNVADPLDPVAADKRIGSDYAPLGNVEIEDNVEFNKDSPRHPHSGTGYLSTSPVRKAVRQVVDRALFQPVAPFVIARDINREFEDAPRESSRETLIELAEFSADKAEPLDQIRADVLKAIEQVRAGSKRTSEIDVMQRFVAVDLTRMEAERLATGEGIPESLKKATRRIWKNSEKRALLTVSNHAVQAVAARNAYEATGRDIHWAVLDTGIFAKHPHFKDAIAANHDCTGRGAVKTVPVTENTDGDGHGTHVAGIIAGRASVKKADGTTVEVSGIAPLSKLHIYKVLDDDGAGRDSWIIKALDHVASINERSVRPIVHGINLSLGGSFDQSTYACGHSPLCRELRRLWQQGVVVVIAAGNEGFAVLESADGPIDANMDISIGDPANLEEAIAVGSVHSEHPHTFGVSYFSSRGPTADGRCKPDVVAPGERIVSCRHRILNTANPLANHYVAMSGTSMAAPHVSGVIAAFLSMRREFIGQASRVKATLLEGCTSLNRDGMQQGRGLVNLVKMLVTT